MVHEMRILTANSTGHFTNGAAVAFQFVGQNLIHLGHEVAWLTSGEPEWSKNTSNFYSLADFHNKTEFKKNSTLGISSLYAVDARRLMRRAIKNFKPQIALIHSIRSRLSDSVLLELKDNNIPVVQYLHDYFLLCPEGTYYSQGKICESCNYGKYYNSVIKGCRSNSRLKSSVLAIQAYLRDKIFRTDGLIDHYIVPSDFLKSKLIEGGYDKRKITAIPYPSLSSELEFKINKEYFLYVGRIDDVKGLDIAIIAAAGLDFPLWVIGDGQNIQKYKQLAKDLGGSNIKFLGRIAHKELYPFYQNALATIVPSKWYDVAPLVVVEAMAAGSPVIGARLGGIEELILENKTGLLFAPENVTQLKKYLIFAIANQDRFIEMGRAAQERMNTVRTQPVYMNAIVATLKNHI